jgi:ParB-like chromosome segregation protein Spo0J
MALAAMPIAGLRLYSRNARTHSKKQIRQIAESIQRFGFTNPVLISDDDEIIAGHGRVEAARLLGLQSIPTLRLSRLNAAQRRAYVIADNKLALNAGPRLPDADRPSHTTLTAGRETSQLPMRSFCT